MEPSVVALDSFAAMRKGLWRKESLSFLKISLLPRKPPVTPVKTKKKLERAYMPKR